MHCLYVENRNKGIGHTNVQKTPLPTYVALIHYDQGEEIVQNVAQPILRKNQYIHNFRGKK
jgi:hypothetical protein